MDIKFLDTILKSITDEEIKIKLNTFFLEQTNEKESIIMRPLKIGDKYECMIEGNRTDKEEIERVATVVEKIGNMEHERVEVQLLKQAKENFINDVINFKFENIDLMLNRSEILGFDFYERRVAVLIEIEDMYALFKDKNELILQHFKDDLYRVVLSVLNQDKDIVSYIGNNRFVICKSDVSNLNEKMETLHHELTKKWKLNFKISIGDRYDMPGIETMAYSFKDADRYILLGKKFLPNEKIYNFEKVGFYLLLVNLPKYEKDKIHRYTNELIEYDAKTKSGIKTFLEALFENNLALTKTEEELNIPKNRGKNIVTLIKEKTGLDPLKFQDAMKLYVSMKASK